MLWERAKNLTLLFFLLINIVLAFFLQADRSRYNVSQEQERAIIEVLKENKISLYSKMIRQFPPMRALTVSGNYYDINALLALFFGDPEKLERLNEPGKEAYVNGDALLVISNGYISYENPSGLEGFQTNPADREAAIRLCNDFITQNYPDYQLEETSAITDEDGLRLCYRQVFKNYIMYANFIEFLVTENGITRIDMKYGEVQDFSGLTQDICSPDEALLTFVQHSRIIYGDTPLLIKMDIVYDQEEFSTQEHVPLQATPYYRIYVDNQEVPFMVNAYKNTIR